MVVAYLIVLDILPPPPTNMEVNPISPSQLKIQWTMPKDVSLVDHFVLNITRLSAFDDEPKVPKKKIDKDPFCNKNLKDPKIYFSHLTTFS